MLERKLGDARDILWAREAEVEKVREEETGSAGGPEAILCLITRITAR
jgi:hypothetical protein